MDEEVGVLLLTGAFWFVALVDGMLLINFLVNRGDVSLNMASSDAELLTFVMPEIPISILCCMSVNESGG